MPKTHEFDLKTAVRSWSAYLVQLIRLQYPGYKPEHNRPTNPIFRCWLMGVMMKPSQSAHTMVREWIRDQRGELPISKVTDMHCLPAAIATVASETIQTFGLHKFFTPSMDPAQG